MSAVFVRAGSLLLVTEARGIESAGAKIPGCCKLSKVGTVLGIEFCLGKSSALLPAESPARNGKVEKTERKESLFLRRGD